MSGPHVFCDLGVHYLCERGIDGLRSSVEFHCDMYESIPAYAGVVVPGLPFLVYVGLFCRAVTDLTTLEFFADEGLGLLE